MNHSTKDYPENKKQKQKTNGLSERENMKKKEKKQFTFIQSIKRIKAGDIYIYMYIYVRCQTC